MTTVVVRSSRRYHAGSEDSQSEGEGQATLDTIGTRRPRQDAACTDARRITAENRRRASQARQSQRNARTQSANPAGQAAHTKLENKSGGEATTETSMMMIWEARTPAPMEEAARQPASSLGGGEADCQTANTPAAPKPVLRCAAISSEPTTAGSLIGRDTQRKTPDFKRNPPD